MAAVLLVMSVTETSFKGQYLIDQGESLSLVGLVFILAAGLALHRRGRLLVSLPLVFPWLLYPVITQGDQIIDNLSIDAMRWVVHILLGLIFGMPVAVLVMAARYLASVNALSARARWTALVPGLRLMAQGRAREGSAWLAASLLTLEMWVANVFLGTLMIVTLIVLVLGVLVWGSRDVPPVTGDPDAQLARRQRAAFVTLLVGVLLSGGLYLGFKNRPGAYQGSPSAYMDPSQAANLFPLDRRAVPALPPAAPASPAAVQAALATYGRSFEQLLQGYYILDRNYNYHFHNELFLRSTPLLPDYRQAGLAQVAAARLLRDDADRCAADAGRDLGRDDPLAVLLDDVRDYAAYSFERARALERLSGEFERTKAGLQHATHLYEGEGKFLGVQLVRLVEKHRAVLEAEALRPVTADFVRASRAVHDKYANRIVGF
jgi:hypothetical protein